MKVVLYIVFDTNTSTLHYVQYFYSYFTLFTILMQLITLLTILIQLLYIIYDIGIDALAMTSDDLEQALLL